ncbi:hypothetical protein KGM_202481 [Danaus plexippus plexippus]|uniref:Uncharacterized protein n=1 Tax=Danaus plexippus plexippus TaxID=278856 RepID=A0A212EXX0_DANPL|nr:hypothetical protein KGM_202481 [Danaus plexippus plexippus]
MILKWHYGPKIAFWNSISDTNERTSKMCRHAFQIVVVYLLIQETLHIKVKAKISQFRPSVAWWPCSLLLMVNTRARTTVSQNNKTTLKKFKELCLKNLCNQKKIVADEEGNKNQLLHKGRWTNDGSVFCVELEMELIVKDREGDN